jgi:hypothetical protein
VVIVQLIGDACGDSFTSSANGACGRQARQDSLGIALTRARYLLILIELSLMSAWPARRIHIGWLRFEAKAKRRSSIIRVVDHSL